MAKEIWGTFSVADHLRDRAFVTDILLYDRLVVPMPPVGDAKEMDRWVDSGWDPYRLEKLVAAIRKENPDLIWEVTWGSERQEQFSRRFEAAKRVAGDAWELAKSRENDPERPAYGMTRQMLYEEASNPASGRDLPPDVWVEAMAAYPSYDAMGKEVKIAPADKSVEPEGRTMAGVFGWDFFAPEEPKMEHLELLTAVAQFVKEGDYSAKRRAFHEQRRLLIQEKAPDRAAVEKMAELARNYASATRAMALRTTALNVLTVLGITAGVASGLGANGAGLVGAFFASMRFLGDVCLPAPEKGQGHKAGAMVHDTRKWFTDHAGK